MNKLISSTVVMLLVIGLYLTAHPALAVQASALDDGDSQLVVTGNELTPGRTGQRLEKVYDRELKGLEKQAERINGLADVSAKTQARIDVLKEKGLEPSKLEAALAEFNSKIPSIEKAHNRAAVILDAHDGFNVDGKVTDFDAARETVKTAGKAMKEAHVQMKNALQQLLLAGKKFKQENKPPVPPEA